MKVYVVYGYWEYENGTEILEVFSTEEKAKEYIDKFDYSFKPKEFYGEFDYLEYKELKIK